MLKYFLSNDSTTLVDGQITAVLAKMDDVEVTSEEYPRLLANLERLNVMRMSERRKPLSLDTLVTVAGTFLGIVVIVAAEHTHVLTSKGFSQLIRPRTETGN